MASNIANALFPVELMSKLCVLGHCEYFFNQLNVHLSSIYITTFWFIYCFIICYLQYNNIWISFETYTGYILYNGQLITTAILIICGMYNKQIYKQCLQQISMINDTLEGLHISNEYENLRKKAMRITIRWILTSISLNAIQIVWYLNKVTGGKKYVASFVVNHTLHVNNLIDVVYEILVWYIGSIFEKINKYILHLTTSTTVASRKFQRCSLIDTAQHKYSLSTIMHTHLELCNTCLKLHKLFQLQLTVAMVTNLLVVVGYMYFQYVHTIRLYQNQLWILPDSIATVATLLFFVWKVIFVNNTIENCCKKVIITTVCLIRAFTVKLKSYLEKGIDINRDTLLLSGPVASTINNHLAHNTECILHILSDCTNNPEGQEEISQFCSQVVHKKLRLSAMGLFYFGHRFLCTYFIVITNYAIITIQFNIA